MLTNNTILQDTRYFFDRAIGTSLIFKNIDHALMFLMYR